MPKKREGGSQTYCELLANKNRAKISLNPQKKAAKTISEDPSAKCARQVGRSVEVKGKFVQESHLTSQEGVFLAFS